MIEPKYHVKIRFPGEKRFRFLGSDGRTSNLRIHACQFPQDKALNICQELAKDNLETRITPAFKKQ